jgi:hypothetical protein
VFFSKRERGSFFPRGGVFFLSRKGEERERGGERDITKK